VECRDGGILEKRRRRGPMHTSNRVRTGGADDEHGRNRDGPHPSTNGSGGADAKWGSDGGSEEKKLKNKKWGRKGGAVLDRGFWIGQGRAVRAVAGSKWMARCTSYWVGFAHRPGWVSRTMARWLVGCISYRGCTHV
jgi:hypothetical protein